MNKKKSVRGMLNDAMHGAVRNAKLAGQNGETNKKIQWEQRAAYYREQLQMLREHEDGVLVARRVFVSYSQKTAIDYFDKVKESLMEDHFEVVTGFEQIDAGKGSVLRTVLAQLRRSSVYIGILTEEYAVSIDGKTTYAPSAWTIEENGMALALEKPYILMIAEKIHHDFWFKVQGSRRHILFNDENFVEKAKELVHEVNNLFNAHAVKVGGTLNLQSIKPNTI